MTESEIYGMIYREVFHNVIENACYVFLCGGAGKNSIRDSVRKRLEKDFPILYPEDLFMDMLNKDRNTDLLAYENLLAQNSDIVCIICESFGSAVELGAFVQNDAIKPKVVVAIKKQYARDKSFIMMGPVKQIVREHKDRLITYKEKEIDVFCNELKKEFRRVKRQWNKDNDRRKFGTLADYILLIPLVLYFYKEVQQDKLEKQIEYCVSKEEDGIVFDQKLFESAIKYLMKTRLVVNTQSVTDNGILKLSKKGYDHALTTLDRARIKNKTFLYDKIRCAILSRQQ